jgi:hypothetical protein
MVMGAGYRLLPMVLPAAMPGGVGPYLATILTQLGAWGLFLGFVLDLPWRRASAVLAALGIAAFLGEVAWMVRHRRPAPAERLRPDPSVAHVAQALLYLLVAVVLGLYLAWAPASEGSLQVATVYGVCALVGFLCQMVVGVAGRLVPLYGWLWGFADRAHRESPPSLHRAPPRLAGALVFGLWTLGVPLLGAGLALPRPVLTSAGAAALLGAVALGGGGLAITLRRLWRRTPSSTF